MSLKEDELQCRSLGSHPSKDERDLADRDIDVTRLRMRLHPDKLSETIINRKCIQESLTEHHNLI